MIRCLPPGFPLNCSNGAACSKASPSGAAGPSVESTHATGPSGAGVAQRLRAALSQTGKGAVHGSQAALVFREFRFDPGKGPQPGPAIPSLRMLARLNGDVAAGAMGSVAIFANARGDRFIGKRIKPEVISRRKARQERMEAASRANNQGSHIGDLLEHEWAGFRKIQEEAGPHPNLVHAYGIGRFGDEEEPTLLMDYVPGMSGTEMFKALRRCLDARRISHAEYTEAIKFVIGRLLDVTGHMARAGVVHLDIKPDNFLIDEKSGELKLIDPGLWAARGSRATRGTRAYAAPEARNPFARVDERSDVFAVAANLLQAWEGYAVLGTLNGPRRAADGLRKDKRLRKDADGNAVRRPGVHATDTAYTRFLASALAKTGNDPEGARRGSRPDPAQAKELEFLADRMLDDDAAKAVLKEAMTLARKEAKKPEGEQWRFRAAGKTVSAELLRETRRMIVELHRKPQWESYVDLVHYSRTNPQLKNYFEMVGTRVLQAKLEEGAARHARRLIERGGNWADATRSVAHGWSWSRAALSISRMWSRHTPVRSGVDKDGVRLKAAGEGAGDVHAPRKSQAQQRIEAWARKRIAPHVALDDLRAYAAEAEVFLRDVETLGPLRDPALKAGIKRIRQLALDARRVLAVSGAGANRDEPPAPRGGPAPQLSLDQVVERMAEKRRAPGVSRPDAQGPDTFHQSGGGTR